MDVPCNFEDIKLTPEVKLIILQRIWQTEDLSLQFSSKRMRKKFKVKISIEAPVPGDKENNASQDNRTCVLQPVRYLTLIREQS